MKSRRPNETKRVKIFSLDVEIKGDKLILLFDVREKTKVENALSSCPLQELRVPFGPFC